MLNDASTCLRSSRVRRPAGRVLSRLGLGAVLVLSSSACVTQARYDEAVQELQYYQRSFHDLDSSMGQLQADLAASRAEVDLLSQTDGAPVEATYNGDIDARLAELRGIVSSLGASAEDVERIDFEGGYGLRMQDAILFGSGRAELLPEGRELVLRLADEIRKEDFASLEVRGHTDSVPVRRPETLERFPHGNLDLSAARAIEVAALLTGEGAIDPIKVSVSGHGPNQPVAPNDTEVNRQRNRRVELIVLE